MSLFLCCSLLCAHNIMCTCLHIIILAPSPYIFHSKGRCYCGNKQAAQLKLWAEVSFECSFYHLNPEGPQVNGGPHALRMILSLITPKTWPASKGRLESKRACPRHFPTFWFPHHLFSEYRLLFTTKSESPKNLGGANHTDFHGAKPGAEKVLVVFSKAPELKFYSVLLWRQIVIMERLTSTFSSPWWESPLDGAEPNNSTFYWKCAGRGLQQVGAKQGKSGESCYPGCLAQLSQP